MYDAIPHVIIPSVTFNFCLHLLNFILLSICNSWKYEMHFSYLHFVKLYMGMK